jgi:hypothetical protein
MGDDTEVTSSSNSHQHSQVIIADVLVSDPSSSTSVDLDLWDLDLNSVYGDTNSTNVGLVNGSVNGGSVSNIISSVVLPIQNNQQPILPATAAKRIHNRQHSLAISSFSDSSSGELKLTSN